MQSNKSVMFLGILFFDRATELFKKINKALNHKTEWDVKIRMYARSFFYKQGEFENFREKYSLFTYQSSNMVHFPLLVSILKGIQGNAAIVFSML